MIDKTFFERAINVALDSEISVHLTFHGPYRLIDSLIYASTVGRVTTEP